MLLHIRRFFLLLLIVLLITRCSGFLDVGNPPDRVAARFVYESDATAATVLTGIYYSLQSNVAQDLAGISFRCGLAADEFNVHPLNIYKGIYSNEEFSDFWTPLYNYVYRINAAIEGINGSVALSDKVKKQLLGEAFFLRGFCYFYLVNFYGDVPLLTTTDYKVNAMAKRVSMDAVYESIVNDLQQADNLLSRDYVSADALTVTDERVRPNKWAAEALLARVYLYTHKWLDAEKNSSKIIDEKEIFDTVLLEDVFLKNSKEAIWQLQPISEDGLYLNTKEAINYTILGDEPDFFMNPVWVGDDFLQSFEVGDNRKIKWLGHTSSSNGNYYYPQKYKVWNADDPPTEYVMVLRLAEQYLIRAEARIERGDFIGALSDINLIRHRAGLPDTTLLIKENVINMLLKERRVEFYTEWGHRWFDLKRTGKIGLVMNKITPQKGGLWNDYKEWLPIPIEDLKLNPNLQQNVGYPSN